MTEKQVGCMATAVAVMCLSIYGVQAAGTNGFTPQRYIGYNHDGSGVYRDGTPVTSWNEWDFKMVPGYDYRWKKEIEVEVPDKERHVNIVWKVPHYNYCNGGMIVAGGKLFALSDRSGHGFYADRVADFVGAELFCINPADGKELWKLDLDHWDLVPDGAELRELVKEYNRKQTEVYKRWWPFGKALRARHSGIELKEERYQRLRAPVAEILPEVPEDLTALNDVKNKQFNNKGYIQLHFFGKIQPKYFPELHAMRRRLLKAGYLLDPWGGLYKPLGLSMMTPVSDGTHVYVSTAYGAVFCVDMQGKIVWKKWLGGGWDRGWAIASPILVGDLLIINGFDPALKKDEATMGKQRMALAKATGELVWQAGFGHAGYQANPVVMDLTVPGGDQQETILLYQDGMVLRARDGKTLATGICSSCTARPWPAEGDVVVALNGVADGGHWKAGEVYKKGWNALRLKLASADEVTAELLWHKDRKQTSYVIRDGIVYTFSWRTGLFAYDLLTGEELGLAPARHPHHRYRTKGQPFHLSQIAGDYFFTLDTEGFSRVIPIGKDGKTFGAPSFNRLGDRLYSRPHVEHPADALFTLGSSPFFSGNRIFIRSNTHLYCIGDPSQSMRLSRFHTTAKAGRISE